MIQLLMHGNIAHGKNVRVSVPFQLCTSMGHMHHKVQGIYLSRLSKLVYLLEDLQVCIIGDVWCFYFT